MSSYFAGRGKPGINAIISAFAFIVTLVLDILLIPWWGIIGAAIATSISYITSMVVSIVYFNSIVKLNFKEILAFKKSDFSVISKIPLIKNL